MQTDHLIVGLKYIRWLFFSQRAIKMFGMLEGLLNIHCNFLVSYPYLV